MQNHPIVILDTCSFRNLLSLRLNEESLLLRLLDFCELYVPPAVKEEIMDDIKKEEIALSEEEINEVEKALKYIRTSYFYKNEKDCQSIIKRVKMDFQNLRKKADKQCIILALQLSRYGKLKTIYVVTDDGELYNIAKDIFDYQFIGEVYSSCHLLVFLSARKILSISKSRLLDMLKNFLEIYRRENIRSEIQKLEHAIQKNICPYSCEHYTKCSIYYNS
jgi:hypothetical protein